MLFTFNLEPQKSWVNFSFKFEGIEKNEEYIEKEDEYDNKPPFLRASL
jgi:hypothetical protein